MRLKKKELKKNNSASKTCLTGKVSIKQKIISMIGVCLLSLAGVVGLGWWELKQVTGGLDIIVNQEFASLIDQELVPMIQEDILPLINEDIANLQQAQHNISLILEADRDVHQAVIAEKMALVATSEEESQAADTANLENIQQAEERMAKALADKADSKIAEEYTKFTEAFAAWKEKTRKVIAQSSEPGKLKFARKSSDGGSAFTTFNTMRDHIDKLQGLQEESIQVILAEVQIEKEDINIKEKHINQKKEAVFAEADDISTESAALAFLFIIIGSVISVVVIIMAVITSRSITKPLRQTSDMLKDIAQGEGDLTRRLEVKSRDEIGELAQWFNTFVDKMHGIIKQIAGNASTLQDSAGQLSSTSTQMAAGAEEMSTQSNAVASASEQMAANMNNMAASSDEMAGNIKTAASSIEEMNASIGEVAKNAEQAAAVADQASQLTQTSNNKIAQLGSAADEIGKVIEVIQDIAEQTNLLALNATIEAARAGDAGKGFAVVATEVKELARQTAEATEDISRRITAIQSSTGESITAIGEISKVIQDVSNVSRTIASAVEEQNITTREIAQNVAQVATASDTVSNGINETANATQEVTKNITRVNDAARQAAQGTDRNQNASNKLAGLSEELQSLVGQFKI